MFNRWKELPEVRAVFHPVNKEDSTSVVSSVSHNDGLDECSSDNESMEDDPARNDSSRESENAEERSDEENNVSSG